MNRLRSLFLTAATSAAAVPAQQLASYDPGAGPDQEFAAAACPPASGTTVDDLVSRAPAGHWFAGAIAADTNTGKLYYATGRAADGIQLIAFRDIGTGAMPTTFATPPGFFHLTDMVVDPRDATAERLFVTDGYYIGLYHAPSATFVGPLMVAPVAPGHFVTGLGYDPFGDRLVLVDNESVIWARPLNTQGGWAGPLLPQVAVPGYATGIAFCRTAPNEVFVSYFHGQVMNPQTGAVLQFPDDHGNTRHHRGLTFMGVAQQRPGCVPPPPWVPRLDLPNGFESGNANALIQVDAQGPTIVALCLGGGLAPITVPGLLNGSLWVDPAACTTVVVGAGSTSLPLSLVNVPAGIAMTCQAATFLASVGDLGDAFHFRTWR
jgi:hypothetical protein